MSARNAVNGTSGTATGNDASSHAVCEQSLHQQQSSIAHVALQDLTRQFPDKVKTLTFDNGSEFVEHEKIAKSLNAKTFFAHPYSSWERGINENTNGLLRQFFPKKTDFKMISNQELKYAAYSG